MSSIRTILDRTDLSAHSRYAFRLARLLARDHGARLVVLFVHSSPDPMVSYGPALERLQPPEDRARLERALRRFRARDSGVAVEHRLAEGEPAEEILRVAQKVGCDLIVMGTHGRTGLGRLLMGSVAEQVVRRAPCPVLTVKAPFPAASPAAAPAAEGGLRTAGVT